MIEAGYRQARRHLDTALTGQRGSRRQSWPGAGFPGTGPAHAPRSKPPIAAPIWLFDLDNTLYPPNTGLMEAISRQIERFIQEQLNLSAEVARALRRAYCERYGSSVRGVLEHCLVDQEEFLTYAHNIAVDAHICPDRELAGALTSLPGPKFIFTNAPASHARNVLRALNVEKHFDAIFDIHFLGMKGKPSIQAYEKVLQALGKPSQQCWFVEDSAPNLSPAKELGCRTVWIAPDGAARPPHVDHVLRRVTHLPDLLSHEDRAARMKGWHR